MFTAQHRRHTDPWSAVFCENPKELIWGSVVTLTIDPDGRETWSSHRFTYTDASGPSHPTPYMLYTLLAYWAITSAIRNPPTGSLIHLHSPSHSLIHKLNSTTPAKR